MNKREKLKKELAVQNSIEPNIHNDLLLGFLDIITTGEQWNAFVEVKHYRYGVLSYQTHRFYYPKKELLDVLKLAPKNQEV